MDSVAEPVMVVTVRTNSGTSVFYHVLLDFLYMFNILNHMCLSVLDALKTMFQVCDVISDSQFVCYTPSLTKTSTSGSDVKTDCEPDKYQNFANELIVRICYSSFFALLPNQHYSLLTFL